MDIWRAFPGPNAAYVLDLWERYRQDPASVPADARAYFERAAIGPEAPGAPGDGRAAAGRGPDPEKVVAAANLAQAIRAHGHLAATLDPLGTPPPGDPALALESYGLTEEDLKRLPAAWSAGRQEAAAMPGRRSRRCARSTPALPATTTTTSRTRESANGCATPPNRAASAPLRSRSTRCRCSSG